MNTTVPWFKICNWRVCEQKLNINIDPIMSKILLIFRARHRIRGCHHWSGTTITVTWHVQRRVKLKRTVRFDEWEDLGFTWDDEDNNMPPLVTDSNTANEDDKCWQQPLSDLNYDILNNNHICRQKPGLYPLNRPYIKPNSTKCQLKLGNRQLVNTEVIYMMANIVKTIHAKSL